MIDWYLLVDSSDPTEAKQIRWFENKAEALAVAAAAVAARRGSLNFVDAPDVVPFLNAHLQSRAAHKRVARRPNARNFKAKLQSSQVTHQPP